MFKQMHKGAMLLSKLTATTGAFLTVLVTASPAVQAKPFLYVTSFSHGGNLKECLAGAKTAMKQEGIDAFYDDFISTKNRYGKVSGHNSNEYLSVEIECDQKMGVTILGVAGLDNDLTWDTYQALKKANW